MSSWSPFIEWMPPMSAGTQKRVEMFLYHSQELLLPLLYLCAIASGGEVPGLITSILWELVRQATSWAPPQIFWLSSRLSAHSSLRTKLYSLWEANGGTSGCPLQGGGPLRLPYMERIQLCPQWANTSPETISPAALCDKRAIDAPGFPFPTCGLTQLFITFLWYWLPGWHWW